MQVASKETINKLNSIFMPVMYAQKTSLENSSRQLVHYTTGENAMRIISDKKIMLRSTVCMNDFSEVQHGKDLIQKALQDSGHRLQNEIVNNLDAVRPGAAAEAFEAFHRNFSQHMNRIYIACLAEHDPKTDYHGKLSMWRAYGHGATGVALVLNKDPFFSNAHSVGFFASPVAYLDNKEVDQTLRKISLNIKNNSRFLSQFSKMQIRDLLLVTLLFGSICLKHPGFSEEREWRLIHLPSIFPSSNVKEQTATIHGTPQRVYMLPLKDIPNLNLIGIELPSLLSNVIIGPTSYPYPAFEALTYEMEKAGVASPETKITISSIPLRT